jgi:hypothetical protein
MKPLPFSMEEINSITRLSQVDHYMRRPCAIKSREFDVPNLGGHSADETKLYIDRSLERWQFLGQPIPVSRFVILREKYTMSLIGALRELDGRELKELLIRLRMVNRDDGPVEHAYSVGVGAVAYAVKLQHGASGLKSFEHYVEHAKTLGKCIHLPPDLRRMPWQT